MCVSNIHIKVRYMYIRWICVIAKTYMWPGMHMCVCVYVHMCLRVHVCRCVCMYACVYNKRP